jgi:predicted nucleic acid-binding protein
MARGNSAGDEFCNSLIYQEILQGAKSAEQFEELRAYFSTLPLLVARDAVRTHEAAAELYVRCRWAGVTPRNGFDCLVAMTAIEQAVDPLADDRDFAAIASIEPRPRLYNRGA